MYYFKNDVTNVFNQRALAREVGISFETINRIFKRKQRCSKMVAYCIAKTINKNAEIEDYFEKVEGG